MSLPDAVLSAVVKVEGTKAATGAISKVQQQLREATKDANVATAAVNRFGRTKGIAVLDVNAAKAKAATAAATKGVQDFGRTIGTATATVNATQVRGTINEASKQVRSYGQMSATATLDANATQVRFTTAQATREVEAFDQMVATATLAVEVTQVRREMAVMRREVDKLRDSMRAAGDGGRDGGKGITLFGRSFGDLPGRIFLSTRLLGALMNILVTMAPVLLGLAAQLVAVASALAPLVGLAAGVGGAMVAAAQGFGVLKLATMGIGDALKEQIKNQSQAGSTALQAAGQQVAASRAIRAAQEGARDAHEAVRKATAALGPAYTEARMRMRDLRDAAIGSALSLRDAQFAAKDARQALGDLLSGPSPRVLADAHRAVADAVRGERDAVQGLMDAHRSLNELLAPPKVLDVADAHDAVADATRDQEKAQIALARQLAETNAVLADPGSSDLDKAEARSRLADAENAVGDAARQSARAQERLRELEAGPSQDAIAEARRRVSDAEEAVARAKDDSARAQEDLAEAESPASADAIARARLAVAQAEHDLSLAMKDRVRAMRDAGLAEAQSIARSPAVLAAREALRSAAVAASRAERGVSEAQADAAQSAGAAAAASANLHDKFDKLPPAAQAFVHVLEGMKPKLDELRAAAASGFFPGATAGLQAAMGSFGSVKKVVGETATVLGDAAKKSGELVGSPAFGKDIEKIGGNNAKVIGTLGEALRHVISAFRHVLIAAGPLTQWLADVANKWALNAAEASKAGRESGKLAEFFEKTKETAQKLGSILGNLASGLFGVGKASSATGRDILDSLDKLTARFADWANSAKGKNEIAAFMEKANEAMKALGPGLGAIIKAFAGFAANVLPAYAKVLQILAPLMDEIVTVFLLWKVAATGAAIATGVLKAAMAVAAFVTGGWTTTFWALNAAMAANPIGLVVIAIAALVAGFILAYKHSETFRNAVDAVWGALKDGFGWVSDNWPLLLAILTGPFGLAVLAIVKYGDDIVGVFKALPGLVVDALKAAPGLLIGAGKWLVETIVSGVKAVPGLIVGAAQWLLSTLKTALAALAAFFVNRGQDVIGWIVAGLRTAPGALLSVGSWLVDVLKTALTAAAAFFTNRGEDVIGWIAAGVRTAPAALVNAGSWLVEQLKTALDTVKDGVTKLGGSVIGWIVDGLKGGANQLVDFLNKILRLIEKIPGIGDGSLGTIPKFKVDKDARGGTFARSGSSPGATEAFVRGGAFARTGGIVNSPITLLGEEAPTHREWVIPENPAYRSRALSLWQAAGQSIGAPAQGFAEGGVIKAFRSAVDKTNANPKPELALWEAGIVESGLRNLTHGHSTSTGALQLLASTAQGMGINAMDPFAVAMGFLTRGYWGKGSAISLAARNPGQSAGWVAQQVQGSAYPDRYDAARSQALQYVRGGGAAGVGASGAANVAGAGGGVVGAVGGFLGDLISKGAGLLLDKLPGLDMLPDWLKGTGRWVLDKAGDWIKGKVSGLASAVGLGGGGGGGVGGDVKGLQPQVKAALSFAKSHGWGGQVNSGFRSHAEQQALYQAYLNGTGNPAAPPGNSMHERGLAVDVSDTEAFARAMGQMGKGRLYRKVAGEPWHFSTTGYAKGGTYGPYGVLGSYAKGTDYVPRDGAYYLHRGEGVTPAAANNAPLEVELTLKGDGPLAEAFAEMIDVKITQNGRDVAAQWGAGRVL